MVSTNIINVSSAAFEKAVLQSATPVLVDFWAQWCQPCKTLALHLEKLAAQTQRVLVAKVDVEECQDLALQYQVQAIPTLLLFQSGQMIARHTGVLSLQGLNQFLDEHLS